MSLAYLCTLLSCLMQLPDEVQERMYTIAQFRFYEDRSTVLTMDDILSQKETLFNFHPEFQPRDYCTACAYWVELDFCIPENGLNYFLEFPDQTIDHISLYLKHELDNGYLQYDLGDKNVFDERDFDHKNFLVRLQKAGHFQGYVRIQSEEYADIRVVIRSINRLLDYALTEYYFYGVFYGMIIIITLYNIFLFFAIKELKYLYYTFYILSVGLFAMSVDGVAFQKLWPNAPGWNHIAHGVALFSIIFWSIIFSRRFLRLNTRSPRIDNVLIGVLIARTAIFLYALIFDNSVFQYRNIEIIPLSLIFMGSISTYLRGYKPARFFIVAYGFLFLGFFIKALMKYSLIPTVYVNQPVIQIISYYSLHLCFVFEMLFLSIALSDRVRILKENRDRAFKRIVAQHEEHLRFKDKLNKELEERIAARTQEIREANQQLSITNDSLARQKEEISAINSLLDLDNWKLRNNLKSAQASRILNEKLSFEGFTDLFSDTNTSMKFLSEFKWEQGYECKRCTNTKYLQGSKPYSRRCTKCGYNETATADTLFHAIKFPIHKALYLVYLHINGIDRTLNELSEEIDLRKNTIWAFKKKIEQHEQDFGRHALDFFGGNQLSKIYSGTI